MRLATQIYNFFSINSAVVAMNVSGQSSVTPKSLGDFIKENIEQVGELFALSGICHRLIDAKLMMKAGTHFIGSPPLNECFYSIGYDSQFIEYGICDFIAFGFPYIRSHFVNSVRAIVVETANNDLSIGTAFLHKSRCLVTAAHCVRNMRKIEIRGWNSSIAPLQDIFVSVDEQCDLAVLRFTNDPFPNIPGFDLETSQILDDVLVMGFPPIPGFETTLTSESAQIAGHIQSTGGQLVASSKSFLDKQDYLLVSARVKGGNSGGPVINRRGKVIGVVAGSPSGANGELDSLGYGAAVPSAVLSDLLWKANLGSAEIRRVPFERIPSGFKTLPFE